MSDIPKDLKYTKDHEWIRNEHGNVGTCGITDHAQELLTDVVFVELPAVGLEVRRGDRIAVVESVKAVSDVYAPASGKVIEINDELEESPGLINSDPYGEGWIFRLDIEDIDELSSLMDAAAYHRHVETGDK